MADKPAANAIASFFTPKSQKPPQKISWQERAPDDDTPSTLLVGKYEPSKDSAISEPASQDTKRNKIAAFDFVSDDAFIRCQTAADLRG
jgi:bifunctional polynucleotide phosphatase/kinase